MTVKRLRPRSIHPRLRKKGFWQRYMEKYGIRKLPREITRPFEVVGAEELDDRELRISPSWGMGMWLYLLRNFGYTAAIIGIAGILASQLGFADPFFRPFLLIGLPAGIFFHLLSYLIKPRQVVFDRTTGMVRTPAHPLLFRKATETPFEEWEAISWFYYTQIGSPTYNFLVRNTKIRYPVLMGVSATFDEVLGMWSFLLQYMKKDAPLPDIPSLAKYPNRTKGLGTWEEWELASRWPDFVDPYEEAVDRMEAEQKKKSETGEATEPLPPGKP